MICNTWRLRQRSQNELPHIRAAWIVALIRMFTKQMYLNCFGERKV